jgi:hypothetical protein
VWILCSRFERRVHGSVNACGCFGDGKCPLRPAMAAVLRTDGTGGPRRPGTERRQRVLVFTAPFAQADVEDDLDRAVAAHSTAVPADRTASDAHSQPAPTAPGAEAADSHARTEHLTSRPIPPKKGWTEARRRRGPAFGERLTPRPPPRASHPPIHYDAVDTVRGRSPGPRESRRDVNLRLRPARGDARSTSPATVLRPMIKIRRPGQEPPAPASPQNDRGPASDTSETGPALRLSPVGTTGFEPATP